MLSDCLRPATGAAAVSEKTQLKPWLKECWLIPPQESAGFVCAMEDMLEVYHRKYQDYEVDANLQWAAYSISPASLGCELGNPEPSMSCKLAGKTAVYLRDRPAAWPNGAHTPEGRGEPWQDHVPV